MDATLDRLIAEGETRGEARGETRGEARGEARVNELGTRMEKSGRTAEFLKSLSDKKLQKRLFIEFKIDKDNR